MTGEAVRDAMTAISIDEARARFRVLELAGILGCAPEVLTAALRSAVTSDPALGRIERIARQRARGPRARGAA
jgi:hypothetical protein